MQLVGRRQPQVGPGKHAISTRNGIEINLTCRHNRWPIKQISNGGHVRARKEWLARCAHAWITQSQGPPRSGHDRIKKEHLVLLPRCGGKLRAILSKKLASFGGAVKAIVALAPGKTGFRQPD